MLNQSLNYAVKSGCVLCGSLYLQTFTNVTS